MSVIERERERERRQQATKGEDMRRRETKEKRREGKLSEGKGRE